jgi:hypothetical protein
VRDNQDIQGGRCSCVDYHGGWGRSPRGPPPLGPPWMCGHRCEPWRKGGQCRSRVQQSHLRLSKSSVLLPLGARLHVSKSFSGISIHRVWAADAPNSVGLSLCCVVRTEERRVGKGVRREKKCGVRTGVLRELAHTAAASHSLVGVSRPHHPPHSRPRRALRGVGVGRGAKNDDGAHGGKQPTPCFATAHAHSPRCTGR